VRYLDRVLNGVGAILAALAFFLDLPLWVGLAGFGLIAVALFLPDRFRR
jgi:uncharacterized membrane protein